ncbi:MAG TPA: chemotaxis protein CheW [Ignavibacteriaceae bacterium]|nr:chemotaxis protein CheW [Ignavibacteriaceae bacterium]
MSIIGINEVRPYLTFTLDDELFSVDVAKVREVLDYTNITKIPRTPEYMRGVFNLRGSVVPVIDLRLKFGMSKTENQRNTCIIVLEISLEDDTLILGALADSVQEVFEIEPEQIEPAPRFGTKFKAEFLKGMGKRDEKFIMILDIDKVFSSDELALVQETQNSHSNEPEAA